MSTIEDVKALRRALNSMTDLVGRGVVTATQAKVITDKVNAALAGTKSTLDIEELAAKEEQLEAKEAALVAREEAVAAKEAELAPEPE